MFPSNTSHAIQPLDVEVFKPLKVHWKVILKQWFRESRQQSVDKAVFFYFASTSLTSRKYLKPEYAVAGFRGSGLFLCDKTKVKDKFVATQQQENDGPNAETNHLTTAILKTVAQQKSHVTSNA